jgi:hypothetical protein
LRPTVYATRGGVPAPSGTHVTVIGPWRLLRREAAKAWKVARSRIRQVRPSGDGDRADAGPSRSNGRHASTSCAGNRGSWPACAGWAGTVASHRLLSRLRLDAVARSRPATLRQRTAIAHKNVGWTLATARSRDGTVRCCRHDGRKGVRNRFPIRAGRTAIGTAMALSTDVDHMWIQGAQGRRTRW